MFASRFTLPAATLAACAALAVPALAEQLRFTADLTTAAVVPPTEGNASGSADVTVDTDASKVSWTVTMQDLSGDATAAHIHGPAAEGENAGPMVDMSGAIMDGSADITAEQIDAMKNGMTYVNVHTQKYPDGEIRGQLKAAN
jgi:Cu/Zn superoxide dismutase